MKILFLTLNQINQGTYWRAYHLGRQLVARGHEVTLLTTSASNQYSFSETTISGLKIVETPDLWAGKLRGYDLWNTYRRLNWLQGRNYDLVHGFESRPAVVYPARMAARQNHAPLILDWADWFGRGGSVEERQNPWIRSILRPIETYYENNFRTQVDGNTVICTTLREKALALSIEPEKILLLPNGSDVERLTPIPVAQARQQSNYRQDDFVIGYVGTIFGRDAQLLAEAFDQVSANLPTARLLIVGYCPVNLQDMVREPAKVFQTGAIPDEDLGPILSTSDVFWLPLNDTNANRGRFPLKLTDYLALRRPIIASAVGDVPIVFSQANIGFLTKPDPIEFCDRTLELFHNPALREVMGENARQLGETHYNWAQLSKILEDFYLIITQKSTHYS